MSDELAVRSGLPVALAAVLLLAGCSAGRPPPAGPSPLASPPQPDAAAAVCAQYSAAVAGPLGTALAGGTGAFGADGTLVAYGGKLARWSYSVTKAGDDTQLAAGMGAAGLAVTAAGVDPVPLRGAALKQATTAVETVTSDCDIVR
jgi:hypothetical protein